MGTTFKIIGFTDSVNECDCCGKQNLKGTYCVNIDGKEFYYGSKCASNAIGLDEREIKSIDSKIKTTQNIDLQMAGANTDYQKAKIVKIAISKGYSKDDFFKKHGEIIETTPWENVYGIAHINHRVTI
jgi:hypothetical protein